MTKKTFAQQIAEIKKGPPAKTRRGRPRNLEEKVRLYSIGKQKTQLRFAFTRAIVEHFALIRDGRPSRVAGQGSHAFIAIRVFLRGVTTHDVPCILLVVEPISFDPRGRKLIKEGKKSKTDRWVVSCPARLVGIIDNAPPTDLDLLWDEKRKGLWLIFPDALMIKNGALAQTHDELMAEIG